MESRKGIPEGPIKRTLHKELIKHINRALGKMDTILEMRSHTTYRP